MPALHDFRCTACDTVFEQVVDMDTDAVDCKVCGKKAVKTFENFRFRKHLEFPDGPWHGLPEVDGKPPEIRTRRQLREALKRKATDEHTESYSAYDDGYAGY